MLYFNNNGVGQPKESLAPVDSDLLIDYINGAEQRKGNIMSIDPQIIKYVGTIVFRSATGPTVPGKITRAIFRESCSVKEMSMTAEWSKYKYNIQGKFDNDEKYRGTLSTVDPTRKYSGSIDCILNKSTETALSLVGDWHEGNDHFGVEISLSKVDRFPDERLS